MSRKSPENLIFDSIRLEGNLFVPAVLEKLAKGEHPSQTSEAYHIPKGLKLVDEYGRAFRIALALWKGFEPITGRSDIDARRATIGFVKELLRDVFGYSGVEELTGPLALADRAYPVALMACGHIPVVVAPHTSDPDTAIEALGIIGSGRRKISAHQLAQQFLDASDACLWAIVTNGKTLRLIRDAETLTRPTFLEFDLEKILREERYPDFAALWRIFHASRAGAAAETEVWERWKSEGEAQGMRVRAGLRNGVTEALSALGNGFLQQRGNEALRQSLLDGSLTVDAYFQQLLRLVYRCLFLFTLEERGLLHVPDDSDAALAARHAYREGYSMRRLKERALRRSTRDPHCDLWLGLRIVFRALASGEPRLALPALGGLFAPQQCPSLDAASLGNAALLTAMRHLRWSVIDGKTSVVDYRNMGPEELGSVYESLLELVPTVDLESRSFGFIGITDAGSTDGNARKTSGSYYTDDSLVQSLLDTALDPVIEARLHERPDSPEAALLGISVIDPACGSGHFLLGAARRLAEQLADIRAIDGAVRPEDYRHALRDVIAHCIHGVDRNPMALELARTALWIEGFEPGRPLSFLDHHLVCGDALLGITDFAQLADGIPDDAFKPLTGDDKDTCSTLSRLNKAARKELTQLKKGNELFNPAACDNLFAALQALEAMPEQSTEAIAAKEAAWLRFLREAKTNAITRAADACIAAFLCEKSGPAALDTTPTTHTLNALLFPSVKDPLLEQRIAHATARCQEARALHWPITFAQVYAKGGFDCVLGNPPWERIKLQEEEFFATRNPAVANAKNKAERGRLIEALQHGSEPEQALHRAFFSARREAEAMSIFAHVKGDAGGRFPYTGVGDVNTYALFSETIAQLVSPRGTAGFIVPTGIATDDSTKAFFGELAQSGKLASLYDFENREGVFPGVHRSYKFCLLTLGQAEAAEFAFFLTQVPQLRDARRRFSLSAEDFRLINPNTLTCPVFRSNADAELTKKIYRRVPVLIEEARGETPEKNPWGISFQAMMHMSNDSHLFHGEGGNGRLPLYEAKMMHQFDHRWATYAWSAEKQALDSQDVTLGQKQRPDYEVQPRYWVDEAQVLARIADAPAALRKAWAAGDMHGLLLPLAHWVEASLPEDPLAALQSPDTRTHPLWRDGGLFETLNARSGDWREARLLKDAQAATPLSEAELQQLQDAPDLPSAVYTLLDQRSPRWLMGWRDITNATNERTVIASVVPRSAVGNKIPLFLSKENPIYLACLLANLDSLVCDFTARQKMGGTTLNYFIFKQFPNLPPDAYSQADLDFIVPRVLELTYTSHSLRGWAADLGHDGPPFAFDPDRRAHLRAELDAHYARLYGLTRDELRYILDPADTHGPDYPSETFRGLKNNDLRLHGHFRTQSLVLQAWDNPRP